eukprot:592669-Prymnesium_polylepis.2
MPHRVKESVEVTCSFGGVPVTLRLSEWRMKHRWFEMHGADVEEKAVEAVEYCEDLEKQEARKREEAREKALEEAQRRVEEREQQEKEEKELILSNLNTGKPMILDDVAFDLTSSEYGNPEWDEDAVLVCSFRLSEDGGKIFHVKLTLGDFQVSAHYVDYYDWVVCRAFENHRNQLTATNKAMKGAKQGAKEATKAVQKAGLKRKREEKAMFGKGR